MSQYKYTQEDYRKVAIDLKPPGRLLRASINFDKVLKCFALGLKDLSEKTESLKDEANPLYTTDLIVEWENVSGLDNADKTISERRTLVSNHLASNLNLNKDTILELVQAAGVTNVVDIEECFQPICGVAECGDPCYGADWKYYFNVITDPVIDVIDFAECGVAECGDPITEYNTIELVGAVRKYKPAHSFDVYNLNS